MWAPRRRRLTLGLVFTITLVASEALAVATILPEVRGDLGHTSLYGWAISGFLLGTLAGTVIGGHQVDRRGSAPPFVAGVSVFLAGLVIAGLAPSMLVLVLGRVVQGLGGGAIPAVAYASIGRSYPDALRPRLFALLSTAWVAPGIFGPAAAAAVAAAFDWRWVFLGLLPLVVLAAGLALAPLRRVPKPDPAGSPGPGGRRVADALLVASGAALLLAGLTTGRPLLAVPLVVAGVAVGWRPLRRVLPVGTLSARRGLPVAVLLRGMLTFGFFAADAYVPLMVTAVRGASTALGGLAITAATLAWTAGAWLQERTSRSWTNRRLVRSGFAVLAAGVAATFVTLFDLLPAVAAVPAFGIAGLGIGMAYSPITMTVLREAPSGQEGSASGSLQLFETFGSSLGIGLGGVAVGAAGQDPTWGVAVAFLLAATMATAGALTARRITPRVLGR